MFVKCSQRLKKAFVKCYEGVFQVFLRFFFNVS